VITRVILVFGREATRRGHGTKYGEVSSGTQWIAQWIAALIMLSSVHMTIVPSRTIIWNVKDINLSSHVSNSTSGFTFCGT
jgi:hypothetical protein